MDTDTRALLDRVERYVRAAPARDGEDETFDSLAREAFAFQHRRVAPVRALAEARGVGPEAVRSWRDVPPVPALAYKSLDLTPAGVEPGQGETVEVFRSSGTTQGIRGVHRHPFPGLYRTVIAASFPRFCLPRGPSGGGPAPMLSLIPPRRDAPDSSLSFMIDFALERWGDEGSRHVFGPGGVDAEAAAGWCRAAEAEGRAVLLLSTAFALASWLDTLAAEGESFRLPAGSVLFETGGFKGRTRELSRGELRARVHERLGIAPERVVREYGMTELTSQLYTPNLVAGLMPDLIKAGGDPDLFVASPWVRVRVLDPDTLEEAPPGRPGLVTIFDLANLSSAVHVMTEDLGSLWELPSGRSGLRLLGRAAGAELRGCSLTAEEMIPA